MDGVIHQEETRGRPEKDEGKTGREADGAGNVKT